MAFSLSRRIAKRSGDGQAFPTGIPHPQSAFRPSGTHRHALRLFARAAIGVDGKFGSRAVLRARERSPESDDIRLESLQIERAKQHQRRPESRRRGPASFLFFRLAGGFDATRISCCGRRPRRIVPSILGDDLYDPWNGQPSNRAAMPGLRAEGRSDQVRRIGGGSPHPLCRERRMRTRAPIFTPAFRKGPQAFASRLATPRQIVQHADG
jgi:hypothetical protein